MSCVELGALDRAVLNVINNAVRHSAGKEVQVLLAPAGSEPGSDLRVCVANEVEDVDARALRGRFGDELTRIFVEPFTTTGSGDGLKICLDFVASAYGLVRGEDAVRAGLVGVTIESGWFFAWLCWPAIA
jgi:signal transduction histidine kinase